MPKPLREPPPSSSVARFLDANAAARAVATPTLESGRPAVSPTGTMHPSTQGLNGTAPQTSVTRPASESRNIKREFILSTEADEICTELVALLRRSTGTRLSSSHVMRGMLKGIATCMETLEHEARRVGRLRLPSNARGNELQREEFEQRLAETFINGIRTAAAYRRREPDGGA